MSLLWSIERNSRCMLVASCGQIIQRTLGKGYDNLDGEVNLANIEKMLDRLEKRLLGISAKISMTMLRRVVHFCFMEIQRHLSSHRETEFSSKSEARERIAS